MEDEIITTKAQITATPKKKTMFFLAISKPNFIASFLEKKLLPEEGLLTCVEDFECAFLPAIS